MKIEDLNKTQIVLLTLLISFVTSIATGIVTVSLMEQAPQTLPQTINRVIERTVETVTPAVTGKPTVVTKETTVVVKEEDLITDSIEKTKSSIVAVRSRSIGADGLVQNTFLGWGAVLSNDGKIITDSNFIINEGNYTVLTNEGVSFVAKVVDQDTQNGIATLEVVYDKENKQHEGYVFTPVKIGDPKKIKLGQTSIAFGGKGVLEVSIGTISSVKQKEIQASGTTTPATTIIDTIGASALPAGGISGGVLLNSFGEVVGLYVKGEDGSLGDAFQPISKVFGA